ncbi:hypothetical protein BDL97_08G112000 [Sphagnum fallax]|nr:hypothetical protein BDL97_08G112000 [Sphagnum fallax]
MAGSGQGLSPAPSFRVRKRIIMGARGWFIGVAAALLLFVMTGYHMVICRFPGTHKLEADNFSRLLVPSSSSSSAAKPQVVTSAQIAATQKLGSVAAMVSNFQVKNARMQFCDQQQQDCNVSNLVYYNTVPHHQQPLARAVMGNKLAEKFKERARRSPQVRVQELEDPNLVSKKFGMVIKVLAFNRLESLIRCLTSLANADYGGDTVKLHILVDHFRFESSESDPSTEEEEEEDDSTPEEGGGAGAGKRRKLLSHESHGLRPVSVGGAPLQQGKEPPLDSVRRTKNFWSTRRDQKQDLLVKTSTKGVVANDGDMEMGAYGNAKNKEEDEIVDRSGTEHGWMQEENADKVGGDHLHMGPILSPMSAIDEAAKRKNFTEGTMVEGTNLAGALDSPKLPLKELKDSSSRDDKEDDSMDNADVLFPPELESKTSVDADLKEAHEILMYVDGFKWQHGPKEVHYRSKKLGLQGQWIEAWWPSNDDEFAFIVEDDVELSRLFYRYLRGVVSTYYYKPQNYDPSIYGVSLQCPQLVPGKGGLPLVVNATGNLFLYQMVGTWGQLLFPRPWKEFRIWYDKCKSKDMRPFLGGMVTNTWNNTQLGEQMWTPWFVKFVHSRGYFNLYTKLQSDQALSILHRDHGGDGGSGGHVNASIKSAAAEPNLKLISVDEAINISLWEMEPLKLIKWYDYCFREVKVGRIANTVAELSGILRLVEVNKTVLIVNAVHVQGWVVQNWLCQMQSLGLRNFVLLGDDRPFVRDLARRGHAVVILSAALSTELLGQEILGIDIIREDDLRQDLITMQVVDAVLHLGYRVWFTRADAIWVHNLLSLFGNKMEQLKVDVAGIELTRDHHRFHRSLLYISNSNATVHLWGKLVNDFLEAAKSDAPDPDLGQLRIMQGESALWWKFLIMSLKSEADFGYRDLSTMLVQPDLMIIGLDDLPPNRRVAMNTSVTNTHIVLLDGFARRKPSDVIQRLNAAGLWLIDKELSCKHIHCQPKLQ